MSIRHLFWPTWRGLFGLSLWLMALAHAQPMNPITLTEALRAATLNLEVVYSESEAAAAKADILAANRSPLPLLSAKTSAIDLQHGVGAGSLWQQKRIDKSLGMDWTWERGGKRALRTRVSERIAQAAQSDVLEMRVQQQHTALEAFYDLLAAQEREQEVVALWQSYEHLSSIAQQRLNAGDLSVQDRTRIAIEAARARADIPAAERERMQAARQLAQAVGQPERAQAPLQAVGAWPDAKNGMPGEHELENGWSTWLEQRPRIQSAKERLAASQASLDLAVAQKTSDITWGSTFDHFPGSSTRLLEFRLQMPLQWGYGFEGEIGRAAAQREQAENRVTQALREARHQLTSLYQAGRAALSKAQIYEQVLLPQAQQVASQAERAYLQGALSLTDLLDARRTLRATRLESLAAKADLAKAQGLWQLYATSL